MANGRTPLPAVFYLPKSPIEEIFSTCKIPVTHFGEIIKQLIYCTLEKQPKQQWHSYCLDNHESNLLPHEKNKTIL